MTTPLEFSLYDTYTKSLVTFNPALTVEPGVLRFYSCGPTVYGYQHIGNLRAAWFGDTINLMAQLAGWKAHWVTNITDVGHLVGDGDDGQNVSTSEDKMEKAARQENKTVEDIVTHYTDDFVAQTKAINLELPTGENLPRATSYIEEQMALALELLTTGKAYLLEDGIYYDSSHDQTEHSGSNEYTGREIKNTTKNSGDFAVWKFVEENALQKWKFNEYDSTAQYILKLQQADPSETNLALPNRWGTPGWHSECVAMICKLFSGSYPPITMGKPIIDLHLGGEDHIDIHHKNEILQSEASGFTLSTHWVHNKFVLIDGGKMSKSKGNIYRIISENEDSISGRGYDPLAYRLMLFEHHYTQQLDFTWDKLTQSQNRLYGMRKDFAQIISFAKHKNIVSSEPHPKQIEILLEPLLNNLNTPLFLEKFQDFSQDILNKIIQDGELNGKNLSTLLHFEKEFLKLNLNPEIPQNITDLSGQRLEAKQKKDYPLADSLRDKIDSQSFQVDDYPWGYGLSKK